MNWESLITIMTNVVVLAFVIWAFFVRKTYDERIAKLGATLKDAADVYTTIASWESARKEIEAMESVLRKRHGHEVESIKREGLGYLIKAKKQQIDLYAEIQLIAAAIKYFIPEEHRGVIYNHFLDKGSDPEDPHVKVWKVDDKYVQEGRQALSKAAENAGKICLANKISKQPGCRSVGWGKPCEPQRASTK